MEEETFPDIGSMSDEEQAELVNRLQENRPDTGALIEGDDVQRLSEVLAGRSEPSTQPLT